MLRLFIQVMFINIKCVPLFFSKQCNYYIHNVAKLQLFLNMSIKSDVYVLLTSENNRNNLTHSVQLIETAGYQRHEVNWGETVHCPVSTNRPKTRSWDSCRSDEFWFVLGMCAWQSPQKRVYRRRILINSIVRYSHPHRSSTPGHRFPRPPHTCTCKPSGDNVKASIDTCTIAVWLSSQYF